MGIVLVSSRDVAFHLVDIGEEEFCFSFHFLEFLFSFGKDHDVWEMGVGVRGGGEKEREGVVGKGK